MDFDYSPKTKELQAKLLQFMDEHIYPAEADYTAELQANTAAGKRWSALNTIENLKPKAQAAGLWNLFLPPTAEGQHGRADADGSSAQSSTVCASGITTPCTPTASAVRLQGAWASRPQSSYSISDLSNLSITRAASHFTAAVRDCLCTLSLKVDRISSSSFMASCQGMRLKVGMGLKPYSAHWSTRTLMMRLPVGKPTQFLPSRCTFSKKRLTTRMPCDTTPGPGARV